MKDVIIQIFKNIIIFLFFAPLTIIEISFKKKELTSAFVNPVKGFLFRGRRSMKGIKSSNFEQWNGKT